MKISPIFLLTLLISHLCSRSAVTQQDPPIAIERQQVAEDYESATTRIGSSGLFSSDLALVRSSLQRFRIGVIRASDYGHSRSTVRTLCELSKAVACINANFFDESGRPLGLIVSRGMTTQSLHRGGQTLTGIFQVTRSRPAIVNRSDYDATPVVEAIQAGPRLLAGGELIPGLKESSSRSHRSGVCIDRAGRTILYSLRTGIFGMSLDQLRILLRDQLHCLDALNLDGGGSSQIFARSEPSSKSSKVLISVEGEDQIPVALGFFVRGTNQ